MVVKRVQDLTDDEILSIYGDCEIVDKSRHVKLINAPNAFDIETSSFRQYDKKIALMYIWQFNLNNTVIIYGRNWSEYQGFIKRLRDVLHLGKLKLVVYVRNLSYEFQFMRRYFKWKKIFAREERKPITAEDSNGIEYRCSLMLSGESLEVTGKHLGIAKKVGQLDYSLVRHEFTELTEPELEYCIYDVLIDGAYIAQEIQRNGSIAAIPLTKTGYVRNYCKRLCFAPDQADHYHHLMHRLTLNYPEYVQLRRAFAGGFTHACAYHVGRVWNDVGSFDFTSSYPAVMLSEPFPMGRGFTQDPKTITELRQLCKTYCCMFDVHFEGLRASTGTDHPISSYKCWDLVLPVIDNGRVVEAESLSMTVTNVDMEYISRFYHIDRMSWSNVVCYEKDYLPRPILAACIQLYKDKTELKGIAGKEIEYQQAKAMLNSMYGMCVTNIMPDEVKYTKEDLWETLKPDPEKATRIMKHYNYKETRFLFYPWGVWITAYARRNLFTGIRACGDDYLYSDTDSLKILHPEQHMDYIRKYNAMITRKLHTMCNRCGFDPADLSPKDIKGREHPLGVWDFEGIYKEFKTLGAKRYIYRDQADQLHITVAGLSKKAVEWFESDPFGRFVDEMRVPAAYTHKLLISYIDEKRTGRVTDYKGESYLYDVMSAVHMEPMEYNMTLSGQYRAFLEGLRNDYL